MLLNSRQYLTRSHLNHLFIITHSRKSLMPSKKYKRFSSSRSCEKNLMAGIKRFCYGLMVTGGNCLREVYTCDWRNAQRSWENCFFLLPEFHWFATMQSRYASVRLQGVVPSTKICRNCFAFFVNWKTMRLGHNLNNSLVSLWNALIEVTSSNLRNVFIIFNDFQCEIKLKSPQRER